MCTSVDPEIPFFSPGCEDHLVKQDFFLPGVKLRSFLEKQVERPLLSFRKGFREALTPSCSN